MPCAADVDARAAFADLKLFPERKSLCLGYHSKNRDLQTPDTPSLGGMPELYALLQLVEFRDGNRQSEVMRAMVKGMTDDDLRAAAFVAAQPRPTAPKAAGNPRKMRRRAALGMAHICKRCHGAQYLGGIQIPPLRNQREDYLLKSMRDFKAERRLGDRAAMVEIVEPLADKDLGDLAHYFAHIRD